MKAAAVSSSISTARSSLSIRSFGGASHSNQRRALIFRTVASAIFAASSRVENAGVFSIREVKSVSS